MTDADARIGRGHAPRVPPDGACRRVAPTLRVALTLRVAQALIEENGWSLLSEQELADRVQRAHPDHALAAQSETRRRVQHQYTIALYESCRQAKDAARRETAYRELHRLLYHAATHRWPELAECATCHPRPRAEALLTAVALPG